MLGLALALCACAPPSPAPVRDPITLTFVLSTIELGADDATGRAHGMDLDGRIGGDPALPCTGAADLFSFRDGAPGIDNQLAVALAGVRALGDPIDLDPPLRDAIQGGHYLVVVEVTDVDDVDDDPSVRVRVLLTQTASGDAPARSGEGLAPGQSFVSTMELGTRPGAIADGRLATTLPRLPLSFEARGVPLTFVFHDVRLEGDLEGMSLASGEVGGSLWPDELRYFDGCPFIECGGDVLISLGPPDLVTGSVPPGSDCGDISGGFGFEAVSAILDE